MRESRLRLNMAWQEFDPAGGKLRAEGSGNLITSRFVRSIGICLEFTTTSGSEISKDDIKANSKSNVKNASGTASKPTSSIGSTLLRSYLPVHGVSYFLFGIVPGNKNLACYDRPLGTIEDIWVFLDFLDNTATESSHLFATLQDAKRERDGWIPGFNDIIPITAPKISAKEFLLCNLPMPNSYSPGLLRSQEGLRVFSERLREFIRQAERPSHQLQSVLNTITELEAYQDWTASDSVWAGISLSQHISPEDAYLAREEFNTKVHLALDKAEEFLQSINTDPYGSIHGYKIELKHGFCYDSLLVEHIRMAVKAYGMAMKKLDLVLGLNTGWTKREIEEGLGKDPMTEHWKGTAGRRSWLVACMNEYWDQLELLSSTIAAWTDTEPSLAVDAWVTMIFRAFCWHHCHRLIPVKKSLPSEWHESQMPVHIG